MAIASFDRLTYWYPEAATPALAGVSTVFDGGTTVVTGASGSGKSTLLRALNGLVPHFHGGRWAGSVKVAGLEVVRTPTARLAERVGFVFQDPERQAVAATVDGEVAFGLENLGVPGREIPARVAEALERVNAAHLGGRRLRELSGGERQRVEIAAAVALRPPLLVLDEPSSQLDGDGAAAVAEACRSLAGEGTAVVVADHRPWLFPTAARIHLDAGRLGQPVADPPVRARRNASPGAETWAAEALVAGIGGRPIVELPRLAGRAGEVIAITGANGCGKTTLLRTLAGLLTPIEGRVRRSSNRMAYLPQDPAALLHRPTVAEEVAYSLRLAGLPASPDAVAAELDAFGLSEVATRYPRDLSGGQRERAALAAVLAGGPVLALLDEPTRGMDAPALASLLAAVERVASTGGCVVIATHDERLAAAADRRVTISGSRAEAVA